MLPVIIGSITVNAVQDTGAYTNMVSQDFYDELRVFQPDVQLNRFRSKRMRDANSNPVAPECEVEFKIEGCDCFLPAKCSAVPTWMGLAKTT